MAPPLTGSSLIPHPQTVQMMTDTVGMRSMKLNERQAPRVLVVGGRVAGLILATRLGHVLGRRALARISPIDRSWVHIVNDFGTPGVVEHCQFIDSPDQVDLFNARLRAQVVRSFANGCNIEIAIVGGGATGLELAAELSRMVDLAAGYGEADIRRRLRLTLLESAPRILNVFPEAVSASAASQLRALGVDVRTGVKVVGADAGDYVLDGGERAHVLLYGHYQLSLHGPGRAALLWLAERINTLVQPDIRIS